MMAVLHLPVWEVLAFGFLLCEMLSPYDARHPSQSLASSKYPESDRRRSCLATLPRWQHKIVHRTQHIQLPRF